MCGVTSNIKHTEAYISQNEMRKRALGSSIAKALDNAIKSGNWPSEAISYTDCHVIEIKRVLDEAELTPVMSEETLVSRIDDIRITGRIDLICKDKDGKRIILDIKTYGSVGDVERAQINLYAHMLKRRGTPVAAAGLLVVPTTGVKLAGYIVWVTPMTVKDACNILNLVGGQE